MTEPNKPDYRDTVFLPKTEFPMRGSLPQQEPKLLERWKAIGLYQRMRAQGKTREKFILHDGPPYANGNIHIGHALNKILKDIVVRSKQMLGYDAPYVPGWDCHGLPIEWKIEEQYRAQGKDKDQVPVLQFRAECRAFAEQWKNIQSEEFQRLGIGGDWAHPYTTMTKKAEAQIVREIHKFLLNGLLYKGVKPVMWSVVEKTALAEAEIEYADHTSTTLWVKFPIIKCGGIPLPLREGLGEGAINTTGIGLDGTPPLLTSPSRGEESGRAGSDVLSQKLQGASIVIWTTTPWTIPGNRAIAFGDFPYALVSVEELAEGGLAKVGEKLVVAEALLDQFAKDAKIARLTKVAALKASDLAGTICAHPFRGRAESESYFDFDVPLYQGEFVTTEAGTGFVHIAPGHGEDDFKLGKAHNIEVPQTVGDDGRYLPNVTGFAGLYVYKPDGKVGEANGAVIKALLAANAMLAKQNIKHSYPHSWRSKAPLIFRTTPQWFIAMDRAPEGGKQTLRELAMQGIGATKWFPGAGENRIRGMIESRPDWCISRQRAWGVPIALFVDKKSGQVLKDKAVLERIATLFEQEGSDAWYSRKPQDFLGASYKADDYAQVFDIVDVWFESGATHAFVLEGMPLSPQRGERVPAQRAGEGGHGIQNSTSPLTPTPLPPEGGEGLKREWPDLRWPASLYLEGSDQHRGWFHSSLLESCGTRGRPPFEAVLTHGFTLDEQGRKMSKSLGNVTAPQQVIDQMGADILRLWVVAADYAEDLRIGPEILKQTGDLYRRFRNTLRYLLGAIDGMSEREQVKPAEMPELERWVLHRLHELDGVIRADIAKYEFNHMLIALHDFCNSDLSAFYFDVRKDSLYCDRPDSARRRAARTVMEQVMNYLQCWLAPILCFTAEEACLIRYGSDSDDSVHLHTFPAAPKDWRDDALAAKWQQIRNLRRVVTGAMELARNDKKIGSSLQAHPQVYLKTEHQKLLQGLDLAEISISSSITVTAAAPPADAFKLTDVPDVGVVIALAQGKKCERCWQVLPEVGEHADHPDLCHRCHDAVLHLRKAAA